MYCVQQLEDDGFAERDQEPIKPDSMLHMPSPASGQPKKFVSSPYSRAVCCFAVPTVHCTSLVHELARTHDLQRC